MILISIISIILSVLLGFYVYLKDKESRPNKIFALWMITAVVSSASNIFQSTASTATIAANTNPLILGTSFLYTSILISLMSMLYYPNFINNKKYFYPFLAFTLFYFVYPFIDHFTGTHYLSNGVVLRGSYYTFVGGKNHLITVFFHTVGLSLTLFLLSFGFVKGKSSDRKQVIVIFLAYMITFMSLSSVHRISDQLLRRLLIDYSTLPLICSFAYFILKHRMFSPLKAALEQAVRNMRDGLIVVDNNGEVLRINKAAENILNMEKSIVNENISELFSLYPWLEKVIKGDEVDVDCILSSPSAETKYTKEWENQTTVNIVKTKIENENREICGALIMVKNITERKIFENRIKDANEFLEYLFDTSPDGIIVNDLNGKILRINEATAKILGFEKEELTGKNTNDFSAGEISAKKSKEFFRILNNNSKVSDFETFCKRKNGEIFPIELSSTLLKDRNGKFSSSVTIFRDISERKKLEREIIDEKNFLEKIIETSVDGIVITHNGGVIKHANKAIIKLSGYEELIGQHIGIFNHEGEGPKGEFLEELIKTGHVSSHESVMKTKSGTLIPIEWSVTLLYDEKGNRAGSMAILRDISLRKEMESQMLQTSKLAAIGELAASVAHELNNPLAGILGYAQLASDKMEKKGLENLEHEDVLKIAGYQKFIEKESIRCKNIVQNLLKFARKSKIEFESVDINSILEETINFTKHQLDINKVELIKNLSENIPNINGNASQLQQVFTNIVINAQKAMPEGGTLTVTSRNLNGNSGKDGEMVEVEFRDTGCGIASEHLRKVFDPFFTTRKIGEGTGLGLSVTYGIIKEHHGEITVDSELGKGTVFKINLPHKISKEMNLSDSSAE